MVSIACAADSDTPMGEEVSMTSVDGGKDERKRQEGKTNESPSQSS